MRMINDTAIVEQGKWLVAGGAEQNSREISS